VWTEGTRQVWKKTFSACLQRINGAMIFHTRIPHHNKNHNQSKSRNPAAPILFVAAATTAFIFPSSSLLVVSAHQQSPIYQQPLVPISPPSSASHVLISQSKQQYYPTRLQTDHAEDPTVVRPRQLRKRDPQQTVSNGPTPPAAPAFPQPFDTSLGTEFESDSCGPFMQKFLADPTFQQCHAFSLLLTTSKAFYQAGRALRATSSSSPSTTSTGADQNDAGRFVMPVHQVLDASCRDTDPDRCEALFAQLASGIKSSQSGCGKDLEKQNSLALQALAGMINYRLMREVACLTSPRPTSAVSTPLNSSAQNLTSNSTNTSQAAPPTGNLQPGTNNLTAQSLPSGTRAYCFEDAIASQTPDDLYYYYLPLGTSLPSGTHPSCNECTKSIVKLYALASSKEEDDLALHDTYPPALTMTNSVCGPGFAPMPRRNGKRLASAGSRRSPSVWNAAVAPLALASFFSFWLMHL